MKNDTTKKRVDFTFSGKCFFCKSTNVKYTKIPHLIYGKNGEQKIKKVKCCVNCYEDNKNT